MKEPTLGAYWEGKQNNGKGEKYMYVVALALALPPLAPSSVPNRPVQIPPWPLPGLGTCIHPSIPDSHCRTFTRSLLRVLGSWLRLHGGSGLIHGLGWSRRRRYSVCASHRNPLNT